MDGVLLIDKGEGLSSFGVIEKLQIALRETKGVKRRDLPKMGHGGTLDPFATGLLAVCVGRAVKLARYFLGSTKVYEARMRFGETTIPGDPTAPVSERSEVRPSSLEAIRERAHRMTLQPYAQTPPMHSAKKRDGKPLYELARQGIEVDRQAKICQLHDFEILSFDGVRSDLRVACSSGTYIRTLSQDLARLLGTVGMLESLRRTQSGALRVEQAFTLEQILEATRSGRDWNTLSCWKPFDRMLDGYSRIELTAEETQDLMHGKQQVLLQLTRRIQPAPLSSSSSAQNDARPAYPLYAEEDGTQRVALYHGLRLTGVALKQQGAWGIERVFPPESKTESPA